MIQAKLHKARQKTFLLLAAKYPEYEFGGIDSSAACHDGQDETGEVCVIEVGDGAPSPPLRLISAPVRRAHILSRTIALLHQGLLRAARAKAELAPDGVDSLHPKMLAEL
jgi:hypothetical protein